jgi:hypothetical protein
MSKKAYKEIIDDVCCEYCDKDHYCILKLFLVESHPSPRLLIQLKLIEKFKYEMSEKEQRDIGWSEAVERWADEGYAKKFADFYSEDKNYKTIYREVMAN